MSEADGSPPFAPVDPYALMRREAAATQVKRFYRHADAVERAGLHALVLDGRAAKTPARADIALPTRAAALLVATEWNAQGEIIRPAAMAATRLVNTVIDGVARTMAEVEAEVVKYAGSDLLVYRAEAPPELAAWQAREWDPVLDWARDTLGARFALAAGVMFVAQPPASLDAVARGVRTAVGTGASAPFRLGALHVMTTLMGSTLLALGVLLGELGPEAAWAKAHVDEDFQASQWGEDEEAVERRANRWRDMAAAAGLLAALDDPVTD